METHKGDASREESGDALRRDGTLKDVSEIEWLHSPSVETKQPFVIEDKLEWPKSPSAPYDNGTNRSGDKRKRQVRSEESGSEDLKAPKRKVRFCRFVLY